MYFNALFLNENLIQQLFIINDKLLHAYPAEGMHTHIWDFCLKVSWFVLSSMCLHDIQVVDLCIIDCFSYLA